MQSNRAETWLSNRVWTGTEHQRHQKSKSHPFPTQRIAWVETDTEDILPSFLKVGGWLSRRLAGARNVQLDQILCYSKARDQQKQAYIVPLS